eukprot:2965605-Amphidinium_carterae.1
MGKGWRYVRAKPIAHCETALPHQRAVWRRWRGGVNESAAAWSRRKWCHRKLTVSCLSLPTWIWIASVGCSG